MGRTASLRHTSLIISIPASNSSTFGATLGFSSVLTLALSRLRLSHVAVEWPIFFLEIAVLVGVPRVLPSIGEFLALLSGAYCVSFVPIRSEPVISARKMARLLDRFSCWVRYFSSIRLFETLSAVILLSLAPSLFFNLCTSAFRF